jgi:hypothetical protein
MMHQWFGVSAIENIPVDVLPAAVEYVHRLTLSGVGATFSENELSDMAVVTRYCALAGELMREVAVPLKALGCEKASTMWTLASESRGFVRRTHEALSRELPKISDARVNVGNVLSRCF